MYHNIRMQELLTAGKAVDVSGCDVNDSGDYILEEFETDKDYCDGKKETWIWSIGRNERTGEILASTTSKFYQKPGFHCLFLR